MREKEREKERTAKGIFSISFWARLVWLLLLFSFVFSSPAGEAKAASAVISLTAGEEEVLKGDTFSVMVTVEAADDIGDVELFVVFDSSMVSFLDDGKYTTGGDGLVLVSDWNGSSNSTRKKYTLEFKAEKNGTCKFSVGSRPAVYLADSEEQMSVSSISMELKIVTKKMEEEPEKETQEVSVTEKAASDRLAELQNIMLAEGTLVPEFDKDITSYKVVLPNGTTKLSLSALAASDAAKVSIEGNEDLSVGENTVTIMVKAANGAKKNYTIIAVREAEMPGLEENGNLGQDAESGVHCQETEEGMVITQYTRLTMAELPAQEQLPKGYMETSIRLDNHSVTAYMPQEDMDSETYLLYGTDGEGNTGFYEYNRVNHTLRPYTADYGGNAMAGQASESVSANFQMMAAIMALIMICAALSAALILQMMKQKQRRGREEDDELFKDYL